MGLAVRDEVKHSKDGTAIALDEAKLSGFRQQIRAWALERGRDFPWRRTSDPYAIFVAEFLLQKTNASKVAPIYQVLMSRYPTPAALARAPLEEMASLLQPLGLSFRADRLLRSMQRVEEDYGGKVPSREAELLQLPGVGPYTARSICAHAFGQPKAVLDTNVARILERFFGLQGGRVKSRSRLLNEAAQQVAPLKEVGAWNLALLDFGAIVCTAINPRCAQCPLQEQCSYLVKDS